MSSGWGCTGCPLVYWMWPSLAEWGMSSTDQTSWQLLPCPSNGGKLSPSQPMIVLAPPCPGPPLFMAYIREEPLLSDKCQGYSVQIINLEMTEDENVAIAVWVHRWVKLSISLINLIDFVSKLWYFLTLIFQFIILRFDIYSVNICFDKLSDLIVLK